MMIQGHPHLLLLLEPGWSRLHHHRPGFKREGPHIVSQVVLRRECLLLVELALAAVALLLLAVVMFLAGMRGKWWTMNLR